MQALESLGQIGITCALRGLAALICAATIGAAAPPTAQAQGTIPALRGVYQGTGASANCLASGQAPVTLNITSQASDNFSGQAVSPSAGTTVFLTGTVDASGHLEGTYDYDVPQDGGGDLNGKGTFTGQFDAAAVPKTIHIDCTGTFTLTGRVSVQCGETLTFDGTLLTAGGPSADLSITGSASPTPVASGNSITYTLTVSNGGPNDASGTLVVNPAPIGISIVTATSTQGACSAAPGGASCSLGTVPNGGTATITITANVFDSAGSTLIDSPNVSSATFDPNLSNNSTTIATPVAGGAVIQLRFSQQPSSDGNPTPAPANLQASPAAATSSASAASAEPAASAASGLGLTAPADACTLSGVRIYKSAQPGVQSMPANLFTTLPPTSLQANVPVAPSGASFVVTNLWTCGSAAMESGVSNEVDVPPGPAITGLKVTGKLKALGSGFAGQVQVFVDGVEFARAAVLADSTLLIQKGPLADGTAIADIGTSKAVLITVKNGDGGFASFSFKRP